MIYLLNGIWTGALLSRLIMNDAHEATYVILGTTAWLYFWMGKDSGSK
jgi:hypothetical protein